MEIHTITIINLLRLDCYLCYIPTLLLENNYCIICVCTLGGFSLPPISNYLKSCASISHCSKNAGTDRYILHILYCVSGFRSLDTCVSLFTASVCVLVLIFSVISNAKSFCEHLKSLRWHLLAPTAKCIS